MDVDEGDLQRGIDDGWIRQALRSGQVAERRRHRAQRRLGDVLDEDRA